MADGGKALATQHLQTIFGPGGGLGLSDAELLGRFIAGPEESSDAAFETIVLRHGAMVQRICRGILRDSHAADDAFQATFLVLARRAHGMAVRGPLGPWLHGVARRVAEHARSDVARRARHERAAAQCKESRLGDDADADATEALARVLHETIDSLPERYRAAIVLCDLEGMTHEQAAAALGCPPGTIKSRLSRGREKLREKLMRRGYGAAPLPPPATAPVEALARAAVRITKSPEAVSEPVRRLSREVLRTMISAKIQTVLAASLIAGLAAGGAMAFWGPPESGHGLPSPIAGPAKSSGEASEKPPTGGQVALRKIAIDADDIREAAGLNIFKFELDMPKDRRFHLVLRERKESSPWRELYRFPFVKSEEGRTTFRVSFMRRDSRFEGVLLSDALDAEFRVASPGCSPTGIATIVQNPLRELPISRRSYRFHFSNSKEDQSVDGDAPEPRVRRLLTMLESSNNPDAPPRPKDAPTRGELVLIEEE